MLPLREKENGSRCPKERPFGVRGNKLTHLGGLKGDQSSNNTCCFNTDIGRQGSGSPKGADGTIKIDIKTRVKKIGPIEERERNKTSIAKRLILKWVGGVSSENKKIT